MKKLLTFFCFMLTFFAYSQTVRLTASGNENQGKDLLRIASMTVHAEVAGNMVNTTVDFIVQNRTNRILEGQFEFPLGEGESVTDYALDINGVLRHGVVVEKEKGRQVFEEIVRRNVDPGLVEMTAGNNFKTRVYPIPANGTRHIQVSYQSSVTYEGERRIYTYNAVPGTKLDSFNWSVTVLDQQKKPVAANGTMELDSTGWSGSVSKKDFTLFEPIRFALDGASFSNEGLVFTQDVGRDTYFSTFVQIKNQAARSKKLPSKIAIWYDISSSAANRNSAKEMDFLRSYLQKISVPTVLVIPFCNEVHAAHKFLFSGKKNDFLELESFLKSLDYDGATNLGYDFLNDAGASSCDEVLLFTDGISTWDDSFASSRAGDFAKSSVLGKNVLYTVNSAASADHAALSTMAHKNGGEYINLSRMTAEQALFAVTHEQFRIVQLDYDESAVLDVFPAVGSPVQESFELCGLLKKKQSVITLGLGYGNTVEQKIVINPSSVTGIPCEYVARRWAAQKIESLSSEYYKNRSQIIALAKQFKIVTKDTSLIVLDSVQDYVRYEIEPPEELLAEYNKIISGRVNPNAQKTATRQNGIPQSVYKTFENFKKWWNTSKGEFKKQSEKPPRRRGVHLPQVEYEDGAPMVYEAQSADMSAFVTDSVMEADVAAEEASVTGAEPRIAAQSVNRPFAGANAAKSAVAAPGSVNGAPIGEEQAAQKIALQAWNPNSPYLSELKRTPTDEMYKKYLLLKADYGASPAFFMECADYFVQEDLQWLAVRILSNLAELELENSDILRALGNKLIEYNLPQLAVPVFEKLTQIKGEIPQFYRDLALAYEQFGEKQKAVDTLYKIVCREWNGRFSDVQQIALNDMNSIIARSAKKEIDTSRFDKTLLTNFDVDLRVVLTWNTDDCDTDLWVTGPDGEKCYYGNKITETGGRMSNDFTQGYGPEEYCIRQAENGSYKIEAHYFASHQQKLLQPVTLQAEVYTNFGRKNQEKKVLTLQLNSVKQAFLIGNVEINLNGAN